MPKERVDVLAYKQGLFETREQLNLPLRHVLLVLVFQKGLVYKPRRQIGRAHV